MIGLLAKKVGMTQLFDDNGLQLPVTVLEVGPCYVSNIRTQERDGYSAVQLAFDKCKEKSLTKAQIGHLKKANVPTSRFLKEIPTPEVEGLQLGTELKVDNFESGDYVDVEGVSIGRGFQGVVKRHNFKAGEKAHGSKFGREPGSTGMSAYPARVIKGMKFPGQMGNKKVVVQNLQVVKVDLENNLLAVEGAVPGHDGAYLVVRNSLKKGSSEKKWKFEEPKAEEAPEEVAVEEAAAEAEEKQQEEVAAEEVKPAAEAPAKEEPKAEEAPQQEEVKEEKKEEDAGGEDK